MKGICGVILISMVVFVCGKPSGDAAAPSQVPQLSDLIAQAKTGIDNLTKDIQEKTGINQEELVKTIKTQSDSLVSNVQTYITKVSEDIKTKSPELEKTWNDVKAKLTEVTNSINAQIPDAKENASLLQEKLTSGLQLILDESNKAVKTINENSGQAQAEIAKFTKQAVEIAAQTTKTLDTKIRELAAAPPAKA